jgi:hypothetical protein
MALYLAEGGSSSRLLGLSCRHVLISRMEANLAYISHPSKPRRPVLLLGRRAFTNLKDSIKLEIGGHAVSVKRWRKRIERFEAREKGTDTVDIEKARTARTETQGLLDKVEKVIVALKALQDQIKTNWSKLDDRVLGHIISSPAINLGVSEHRFTEDWGIFEVNRAKLGDGFHGNKMDLGVF